MEQSALCRSAPQFAETDWDMVYKFAIMATRLDVQAIASQMQDSHVLELLEPSLIVKLDVEMEY